MKVSKQRKAEIDKIANLPAEAGVTLEEYEEWNQINMPGMLILLILTKLQPLPSPPF